jgi:hypothetical protein
MMLYSAAAAILGPALLLQLRSMSELKYINELLHIVRRAGIHMHACFMTIRNAHSCLVH